MSNDRSGRRFVRPVLLLSAIGVIAAGAVWYLQNETGTLGDATDLDQVAFGSRVYSRICSNCHGTGLDGQLGWKEPLKDGTRLAPAHSADGETWRRADDTLFQVVKFGGDSIKTEGETSRMPGFSKKLTDEEIWAVIAFIKSTWPNSVQEAQQDAKTETR